MWLRRICVETGPIQPTARICPQKGRILILRKWFIGAMTRELLLIRWFCTKPCNIMNSRKPETWATMALTFPRINLPYMILTATEMRSWYLSTPQPIMQAWLWWSMISTAPLEWFVKNFSSIHRSTFMTMESLKQMHPITMEMVESSGHTRCTATTLKPIFTIKLPV